ncbi:MAPEG family protein [Alteromonas sp. CI.11.F.A3]|uniref:MAPEG family protein n=1 Tax=Alteromonas sp. CI.11.F.A3 TaxID=3079555 RepID=UPI002942E7E0|nr:MAPEG family protein [Alteromonas sp. CI.11.F.A3]WOI37834.1 MAPEG family protein [Alteromonas sp. CI.11.F.A3]
MDSLVVPMFAHVLLCTFFYMLLTFVRAPKVWGLGRNDDGSSPFDAIQSKISANLSNQFEWPLFFHVICVVLIVKGLELQPIYVALAWVFVVGRIVHSAVQIMTSNIKLRGIVFTLNFLAVLAMWSIFVAEMLVVKS